jgi:phosphoglycolate phosphatase-like HAD superfamily hydrolase
MRLLLFDIDGTLINSSRIGRAALGRALVDVFGTAGALESYEFAGKTDRRIVHDLMIGEGWLEEAVRERHEQLDERMAVAGQALFTAETIWPCPGVLPLLDSLRRREDVILALLTGNIRHTVPLKLAAAGIDPALFMTGAYGSDSFDRNELFAVALDRVRRETGHHFTGEDVVIIGDTPADIRCARSGGGRAIAVATGPYSAEVLYQNRPDHLFNDLTRTEDVLQAMLNPAAAPV